MIQDKTHLVPTLDINIPPGRQRQEIPQSHIENLSESILARGLIHPIVLQPDLTLVVGECRLHAWRRLEKMIPERYGSGIPARFTDEMEPTELRAIELEENIQRLDLSWQEAAVAFHEYYENRTKWCLENEKYDDETPVEYTYASMSGELNCSKTHCNRMVMVGRAVSLGDEAILACQSARAAGALLDRRTKRAIEIDLTTFGEAEASPLPLSQMKGTALKDLELDLDLDTPIEPGLLENFEIIQEDFCRWADVYEGPKFNFVHCDFPYGIYIHESDLYKTAAKDHSYMDSAELYESLCDSLIYAKDTILSASCHVMFWFPMSKYWGTLRLFQDQGFRVEPYPLFWMKSDKMGIVPDPARGPRRIYETAFIMSLGDRKVIKPTVNGAHYPSGGKDKEHASQKPMEMLEDFFRMFVDEDTIALDTTCGSGTALAAAIKLGAKSVLGLDISPSCTELAADNCRNQFTLKLKE